ncbi:MAG: hypothetical protein KF709_13375 [Gemmatimonadaceae bacterium]|nr:hypothetical protein [Gemmatimonadaceae bacterium]
MSARFPRSLALLGLLVATQLAAATAGEPDDRVRTAPVSISGVPRALVSVAIEVPSDLQSADSLTFSVDVKGGAEVLGRREGAVVRHQGTGLWRPILLTVRVPSNAKTGLIDVADVIFADGSGREVVVPLVLRVPTVSELRVDAPKVYGNLMPGDRLDLLYRVHNEGNAPEVLLLESRVPSGWRSRIIDTLTVSVDPFASAELRVTVRVPIGSNRGEYYAAANLLRPDNDSLLAPTAVTALHVDARHEVQEGSLTLRPMTVLTASSVGSGLTVGMRAEGNIAEGVHVRAQLLPPQRRSGLETIALASVGGLGNPFQASVTAETWSADAGLVTADLAPLTGVLAIAEGMSGQARLGDLSMRAFAGRSGLRGSATGSHVGAGMWMPTNLGDLGVTASIRRESFGGGYDRRLSALGVDLGRTLNDGTRLNSSLALRGTADGLGLGYRLEGARDYGSGRVRASYGYAPGGSAAFAIGTQNFDVEATHEFSDRWRSTGTLRTMKDDAPSGLQVRSFVLGLGQLYQWRPATSFTFNGSVSTFGGRAPSASGGSFGSSNLLSSLGAAQRWHEWTLNSSLQLGIVGRSTELSSGATNDVRVLQKGIQLSASRSWLQVGQVSFGGSRLVTGAGAGQPTNVTSIFGRFSSATLLVGSFPLRGTAEMQLLNAEYTPTLVSWRVGASTPLPMGLELESSVERNPFFLDRNGNAGWAVAMRVTASASVFTPKRSGYQGVVFEDHNGNGQRDADEPGVGGVRVIHGDLRISTDRDGRYTLPRGVRGRVRVDVATLPSGWLVHPGAAAGVDERLDVPLVATGGVTLRLVVDADEDGRRPEVDLSEASVWLVDRDGREWLGRATPNGEYRFENIPAGRYGVQADLSRLTEPLRVAEGESAQVVAGSTRAHTVHLRGRAVRIIQPPSRGGTGGRGGTRGSGRGGHTGSGAESSR